MNDYNIYETLKISIYCSWEELMTRYQEYTRELKQDQYKANASAQALLDKYPWLDKVADVQNFEPRNSQEAEIFNSYNRYVQNSERNSRLYSRITRALVDTQIATNYGKQAKEEYDKTHKTAYAILGMSPYVRMGDLPSVDKVKELAQKYPEKEQEIKKAFEEVTLQELGKQNRYNNAQNKKDKTKEELPKNKNRFKNFIKKFIAPALVVLGLTPAIQALPEATTPEEPQSEPKQTEKETFKEQLKVNGATVTFEEQETVITPNDQFVISQYRTTSFENILKAQEESKQTSTTILDSTPNITPTVKAQSVVNDRLSGLKSKIKNDSKLNKVAHDALSNVAVNGNYDASISDKLDYIMNLIDNKNVDCVLSSYMASGGIKNCILDFVDDVALYYIEKETGKDNIALRFEKDGDFSLIDKSGTKYVATTSERIGNTSNSKVGSNQTVSGHVSGTLKSSHYLREKEMRADDFGINSEIQRLENLLTNLNTIGNDEIIVSRNDRER